MQVKDYKITLEAARRNKRLTQGEAADILGVNVMTLAGWEKGKTKLDIRTFKRLCEIYEVPEELIFLPDKLT